ncbi:glycosyltransferase family 4 protein [Anaerobium acetethylicum]|uniref:Glycosyltransferase involved in cell wall bisynthesis n=1 Tax=Anaerobium acetethylicum TaxID=1619234 RepID=A0A1D3TRA6_9FIRM|nr:glycosyltransferase family 4 protein [Anaerobium acetethylicum]SCP96235.1 Glycosyltransferase involved in cell wall bisynthesis [Anaerobium acetethylicum]
MVKVLMVGNDSSVKGGITSVITQMLSHDWVADGVEMKFIPTYIEANNFKKIIFFEKAYSKIKTEIKTNKPDVVHIHMSYKGSFTRKFLIHKLCRNNGIPDIIHLHGSEFKKWYDSSNQKKQKEIRTLLKEASAFIVLGEKWNKVIKEIEPTTNTVVVNNTVHIPEETVKWAEPLNILFLGVLIKRKGVSDLLKATKLLKDDLGNNKFKIIIAGSGAEEENLKNEFEELKIDDVVNFVGWTDGEKKQKLLRECQMLVLPSYNEGLPIAILEAMSYGMPIVATDVGDISSAVIDGDNGYLVDPGDVKQLTNAIKKLINIDEFTKLSVGSKSICYNNFSDSLYFKRLLDLYQARWCCNEK